MENEWFRVFESIFVLIINKSLLISGSTKILSILLLLIGVLHLLLLPFHWYIIVHSHPHTSLLHQRYLVIERGILILEVFGHSHLLLKPLGMLVILLDLELLLL